MKGTETMKPFARINLSSVLSSVALAKVDALRRVILAREGNVANVEVLPMTMLPIANERKTAMKKLMVATGCTAMAAIVGCSDTQKSAESIGIIGGDDGPTATWMTTQLPWNRFCNRDFLDYVIPAFSITPGMTMEEVATKLEQTVNTHVANENSPVKVDYFTAIDYIPPLQQQTWTNVTVRTLLTDIAKADPLRPHCLWDSEHRIVSFLVPAELSEAEWWELIRGRGETVYAPQEK